MFYNTSVKIIVEVVVKTIVSEGSLPKECLHQDFSRITCVNVVPLLHIVAISLIVFLKVFAIGRA